jgi:uncharacterized membrane protein
MAMEVNPIILSLAYALHMLATVVWIGGLLYQSIFLLPEVRRINEPEIILALLERLRTRFQPVAWLSLAILIGTGLIQMATNPNYAGILAIENTWSKAIFIKHIAIGFMIAIAAYQSFLLYPRLTRSLMLQMRSKDSPGETLSIGADQGLLRLNIILSISVLLLTSIARIA